MLESGCDIFLSALTCRSRSDWSKGQFAKRRKERVPVTIGCFLPVSQQGFQIFLIVSLDLRPTSFRLNDSHHSIRIFRINSNKNPWNSSLVSRRWYIVDLYVLQGFFGHARCPIAWTAFPLRVSRLV